MINFYPGPSKIDKRLHQWLQEGLESGMVEMNHRSEAFMFQYSEIVDLFQEVFDLPQDYEVYFTSSATECWQIIAQGFAGKSFLHVFNGSFGEKWANMNVALGNNARSESFGYKRFPPELKNVKEDIICLTHNETSNGSKLPDTYLTELRRLNPHSIIAVDATSSMAGVELPWLAADIWFASVQKCFGLPAGMGVMFMHKRLLKEISGQPYYNHISNLHKHYSNWQSPYTPNTTNIYFLWQLLQDHRGLKLKSEKIKKRARHIYSRIEAIDVFELLIENQVLRSDTVIAVKISEAELKDLKRYLESREIMLGNGYGPWKNKTFRIANFPAIKRPDFDVLFKHMEKWLKKRA